MTTATLPRRKPGPKPGEHKAKPLTIFPDLPTPTGLAVRELRIASGWTLEQTAALIGLYDAAAVSEIERGARPMTNARWTIMLLAAGKHPTRKVVAIDEEQPGDQPLS